MLIRYSGFDVVRYGTGGYGRCCSMFYNTYKMVMLQIVELINDKKDAKHKKYSAQGSNQMIEVLIINAQFACVFDEIGLERKKRQ